MNVAWEEGSRVLSVKRFLCSINLNLIVIHWPSLFNSGPPRNSRRGFHRYIWWNSFMAEFTHLYYTLSVSALSAQPLSHWPRACKNPPRHPPNTERPASLSLKEIPVPQHGRRRRPCTLWHDSAAPFVHLCSFTSLSLSATIRFPSITTFKRTFYT